MGGALTFLGGGSFVVLLLGGIGYIFQRPLTAWLTRRMTAELEKQADDYKHQLSRDMERYKDELGRLQNADRVKMDVRKAVAEKFLEQRLAALHAISAQVRDVPVWVVAAMAHSNAHRQDRSVISEKMDAFYFAVNQNALHLPGPVQIAYRRLGQALMHIGKDWTSGTIIPMDDPRSRGIVDLAGEAGRLIHTAHLALPDEMANIIARGTERAQA
ncbi:hypothetical protein SB861_03330 [Paraburkholderia sp. SIMBA_049]